MFMNTESTGYGEDTEWKARYRLSTLNFGLYKRSLNTNTGILPHVRLFPEPVLLITLYEDDILL
jgi:hypothetical protein